MRVQQPPVLRRSCWPGQRDHVAPTLPLLANLGGEPVSLPERSRRSPTADGSGEDHCCELFRLVARARELGRDPEMELRAARRYRDLVHAWERS
jgi:hypothetical protein